MTQPDLIFVFATLSEAQPLIDLLDARELTPDRQQFRAYFDAQTLLIVICGMGPHAAATVMHRIVRQYPQGKVLNCGIAGSLTDDPAVGDVFCIRRSRMQQHCRVTDEHHEIRATDIQLPGFRQGSLLTVDSPVFDPVQKQALSHVAQLVDMEGGVIARICRHHGIACQLLKAVSDFSEERQQLHRNLRAVSELLARQIVDGLEYLNHPFSPQQVAV